MSKPVRLAKQENHGYSFINSFQGRIERMILSHPRFFLGLLLTVMIILFVVICFAICGASATDSGVQYNQFDQII